MRGPYCRGASANLAQIEVNIHHAANPHEHLPLFIAGYVPVQNDFSEQEHVTELLTSIRKKRLEKIIAAEKELVKSPGTSESEEDIELPDMS